MRIAILCLVLFARCADTAITNRDNVGCSDSLLIAPRKSSSLGPYASSLVSTLPTINLDPPVLGRLLPRIFLPSIRPITEIGLSLQKVCVELSTESESDAKVTIDTIAMSRVPAKLLIITASTSIRKAAEKFHDSRPVTDIGIFFSPEATNGTLTEEFNFKARDNARWRVMTVNHVNMLPPYAVQVGPTVVGADIDMTKLIGKKLGIGINYKLAMTFAALSEELTDGETSFSTSQAAHDLQQLRWGIEISHYVQRPQLGFTYKLPDPVDRYLTLVSPFTNAVWSMLILSIFAMIAFLSFAENFGIRTLNFYKVAITCVALINESMPDTYLLLRHRHKAVYLVLFVWITLSSLLAKAYNSTLLASLVTVTYDDPIDTWQDLLDNNIKLPLFEGSTISDRLQYASQESLRRVYQEQVVMYDNNITPKWVSELIKRGEAASLTTELLMWGNRHKEMMSVDRTWSTYSGYLYSLKFPFKDDIDWIIAACHETGIYHHFIMEFLWGMARPERDYERNAAEAPKGFATKIGAGTSLDSSLRQALFSPLSPQQLAPAIFLALLLLAVAAITFLLELAYVRAKKALEAEKWMDMGNVQLAWS